MDTLFDIYTLIEHLLAYCLVCVGLLQKNLKIYFEGKGILENLQPCLQMPNSEHCKKISDFSWWNFNVTFMYC